MLANGGCHVGIKAGVKIKGSAIEFLIFHIEGWVVVRGLKQF